MYYNQKATEVAEKLSVNTEAGLSSNEVQSRLEKYGYNELKQGKKEPLILRFLKQFADVLIIILLIAAVVSIILEPKDWIESMIIFVVVLLNAILGTVQESRAEKRGLT